MKWEEKQLGDLIETVKGFAFKSEWFQRVGIPIVKVKDFTSNSISDKDLDYISPEKAGEFQKYALTSDDVIIQTVGSWASNPNSVVGKVVCTPKHLEDALLNQNAVKLIPNGLLNKKFLFYRLRSDDFKGFIIGTAQGAANQASITLESIRKYSFPLPPLPTQQKIAAILSAYDDLIENNLRRIRLLEEAAGHLYREWFVRFRFPATSGRPGWEEVRVVDGLPEGWERKKIGEVCETIGGGTPSTKETKFWEGGEIIWFSPTDLSKNSSLVLLNSFTKITEEGLKSSSAKLLPPRTILMSSRATIGLFGIISKPCSTNQGFISIIPNEENFRFYLLFNLINRKQEIINNANGSTFKEISKKNFREMEIVMPSPDLAQKFQVWAETFLNQVENLEKQNQKLKAARDILLPRLMNQTIEV